MALPTVLTALVELVGEEIAEYLTTNWPDAPLPERTLRYHGSREMPQDCCTPAGYVVANWSPITAASGAAHSAGGFPQVQIVVRYVTCWPAPEVGTSGVKLRDDAWDETAARLAGIAEAVTHALVCLGQTSTAELTATAGCAGVTFNRCEPIGPLDVCCGVAWTVTIRMLGA